jgi:glycerol transport system ATP-binding protein
VSLVLDGIGLKRGDETLIADASLTLEAGSMNVLLGPTLSGKTTLMRLMAGLDRPTSGRLVEDGRDVTGVGVKSRSVAMVYQQFVNYPTLSVYENIASPLRVQGLGRAEIEARVSRAAKLMRLEPMLRRTPAQLSGGQQQRTALARALVKQARLVLLDEPLANLDYKLREELREELPRIFAETGAILVYATTEPTEALLLRGRTATLREGRITQMGPTARLYRDPANLDAARVFSDPPLNELALTVAEGAARLADGTRLPAGGPLAGLPDGAVTLGFRADAATVVAAKVTAATGAVPSSGAPAGAPRLRCPGTVSVTEISGSESFVHVATDAGLGTWVCLVEGVHAFEPGDRVEAELDLAEVFLFGPGGERLTPAAAPAGAARRDTVPA